MKRQLKERLVGNRHFCHSIVYRILSSSGTLPIVSVLHAFVLDLDTIRSLL